MRPSTCFLILMLLATGAVCLWPRAGAAGTKTVTMAVWGMPFEDRLFRDRYAREFERLNPGVAVDYQRHADLLPKYNAWHARGLGAGVMRVRLTDYHQLAERGVLEPLDAYIADPQDGMSVEELAQFPANLWAAVETGGKHYALPQDNAQYGLYYNEDLIARHNAGSTTDAVSPPDSTWNWETLRRAARLLTKKDAAGNVVVRGIDLTVWAWPFMHFFAQAGGELWSADGRTTLIDSDAGVRALEFLGSLVKDGSWQPLFGRNQGAGPDYRFAAGQVALFLDGCWMVPSFEQRAPELNFAVAPMPRGDNCKLVSGCVVWAMSSNAPDKQLAWRMLKWLVSPEQALQYWDTLRVAPPANTAVLAMPEFRTPRGIADPDRPGAWIVPPMREGMYEKRVAWLSYGMMPQPECGTLPPAFVPSSRFQSRLELEIEGVLQEYLRDPTRADPKALLARAAARVNEEIARASLVTR